MLRPQGWLRTVDRDGRASEADTFTCRHCSRVHEVKPGSAVDYDFCRSCMAPICPRCAGNPCDHFEEKLARAEARQRFWRDLDLS